MNMFHSIRKHLSYANVAATMALVFALTGGAVAASSHGGGASSPAGAVASAPVGRGGSGAQATAAVGGNTLLATASKSKPKGKTGPRGPKGPTGPAGKNGTNGTNGANGAPGAKGENGAAGGQGPQGPAGPAGPTGPQGEIGEPGEAGPAGAIHGQEPLPPEATETGSWAFGEVPQTEVPSTGETVLESAYYHTVLSFPIQLAAPLAVGDVHYVKTAEQTGTEPSGCVVAGKNGTAAAPKASPGNLCVYEAKNSGMKF